MSLNVTNEYSNWVFFAHEQSWRYRLKSLSWQFFMSTVYYYIWCKRTWMDNNILTGGHKDGGTPESSMNRSSNWFWMTLILVITTKYKSGVMNISMQMSVLVVWGFRGKGNGESCLLHRLPLSFHGPFAPVRSTRDWSRHNQLPTGWVDRQIHQRQCCVDVSKGDRGGLRCRRMLRSYESDCHLG